MLIETLLNESFMYSDLTDVSCTVTSHCLGGGAQNTSPRHPRHHVNQIDTTTIHHDILWLIREKLFQNRQHWTTISHRTEFEENPLMVDPVKSGTEVDLNYSRIVPHLQIIL